MTDIDDEVTELYHAIGVLCDQKNVHVVIPALSHMVVAAVLASHCTLAGVDDYVEVLHEQLRAEWLRSQPGNNGSEAPS